jgi:hypothetical protein
MFTYKSVFRIGQHVHYRGSQASQYPSQTNRFVVVGIEAQSMSTYAEALPHALVAGRTTQPFRTWLACTAFDHDKEVLDPDLEIAVLRRVRETSVASLQCMQLVFR